MQLTDVAGIGPAKANQLTSIGIESVADLAAIDLRRTPDLGISAEVLKKAKADARKKCAAAGIVYSKAPYGASNGASNGATKAAKPQPVASEPAKPKGFLARLLRR